MRTAAEQHTDDRPDRERLGDEDATRPALFAGRVGADRVSEIDADLPESLELDRHVRTVDRGPLPDGNTAPELA